MMNRSIGTGIVIIALVNMVLWFPVMAGTSRTPDPEWIPDILDPWIPYVLHGNEHLLLGVPDYNDFSRLNHAWPVALTLNASASGAEFIQDWWITFESDVPLPGDDPLWSVDVRVDGTPAVVMKRGTRSTVHLTRGTHRITGRIRWNTLPEHLPIPADTGLVTLTVDGQIVPFPRLDESGRLWFHVQRTAEEMTENRLTVQSFRLITDDIPPRVTLFLRLEVSGAARETVLGPIFSRDTFLPVSMESGLPGRIEPDGRLILQLRPGQWTVTLTLRHIGSLTTLTFDSPSDGFWPDESIWSFEAQPSLRIVEVSGAPAIDPQQTSLPPEWRRFPAYRMTAGDTLTFNELKRGDPEPAPDQLNLDRTLWLRFDGSGYTVQDRISGKKNNDWRLEMPPPIRLGKVEIDGMIQFITQREEAGAHGVEIRRGSVNLTADSEFAGGTLRMPLTGWNQAFQSVRTTLVLPPGYRLLHAFGIDNVPQTWITRWNLLDLFLLLLISAAVGRLFSLRAGLLAFVTIGLLMHEPGAPVWIWLAMIVGVALLKIIPGGWIRRTVQVYQVIMMVILAVISIVFAFNHIRTGLYPQLEQVSRGEAMTRYGGMAASAGDVQEVTMMQDGYAGLAASVMESDESSVDSYAQKAPPLPVRRKSVAQYDPRMLNQTGPGLPEWAWRSVHMVSGPAVPGQMLTLFFTGPVTNRILAFVRVSLLIFLAFTITGIRYTRRDGWSRPGLKMLLPFIICVFIAGMLIIPPAARCNAFPSDKMLDGLLKHLLERENCFPYCADVAGLDITVT
ncbi:hypothetical protein JXA80_00005, partial [bacterium]|nr:hypothetical protein [candidate division CSSED10-310 bacterium]